ncbi:MAG: hypothetical protein NT068_04135 [Candidatus Nomurabacteria bacterium]|nr:hypothetical protein [Candidatus Nomurabacteria bacterium]
MKNISINIIKKTFTIFSFIVILLLPVSKASALTLTPTRLEISGDAGQTISQEMTLINERDTEETYYSSYANFEAQGESGSPSFIEAKDDVGTWMSSVTSVVLPPKSSKIIQVKINIPKDADAGGHFGAIFWGNTSSNNNGQLGVGAKTGMLILLTVNGNVTEKGGILEFSTQNKQTFFTSLPVSFYYRFRNEGGNRIKPNGNIVFKNIIGMISAKISGNPVEGNVLPNQVRRFETTWQGKDGPTPLEEKDKGNFFNKIGYEWRNFAFGHYKAEINLSYGLKNEVATALFSFWVFPWHLTIFVIILLLVIFFGGKFLIKKYNHWVIRQAEEILRKEDHKKKVHEEKLSNKKI